MTDTTDTTVKSAVTTDLAWLKTHVILLVFVTALALGGVYEVESIITRHDIASEERYSKILTMQSAQTSALEAQLKTDESNWTQLSVQLTHQNQAAQQQINARDQQITQLLTKISTAQPPQIVADLQPKLHAGTATVLSDGVKLDTAAARDVDEQITQGTGAAADLVNTKTQLANEIILSGSVSKNLTEADAALLAEQKKNQDQIVACAAEVKVVKAQARKSKLKWFITGVITGIIGGRYI